MTKAVGAVMNTTVFEDGAQAKPWPEATNRHARFALRSLIESFMDELLETEDSLAFGDGGGRSGLSHLCRRPH
jgi:hypothetical protein